MSGWESLEQAADEYVSLLLDTPPNGWGQHVHPTYGTSTSMMFKIIKTYGDFVAQRAVEEAIQRRINAKKAAHIREVR